MPRGILFHFRKYKAGTTDVWPCGKQTMWKKIKMNYIISLVKVSNQENYTGGRAVRSFIET